MRLGRLISLVTGAVIVGALAYALWPKPVPVDAAPVRRTDMAVTVDEDGKTRVRERYVISSPLPAQLLRVDLDPGDPVIADKTVLAVLEPTAPALLDPRTALEAEAQVRAAEAAVEQATPNIQRAEAALELARLEHERLRSAVGSRIVSQQDLDRAAYTEQMRAAELDTARFQLRIAQFQLDQARAALARTRPEGAPAAGGADQRIQILAPVSGRVLRVFQESGAAVASGAAILEVGDPSDIEVEVDVLSADAVKIRPQAPVFLEHWGGDRPLRGIVRLVEPSGFLKISALGVEEQRVNVIIDLTDPIEERPTLGDGYRVEARIVVWDGRGVLAAPIGAVFRHKDGWATYALKSGRAELRPLLIGHQNQAMAEVVDGLTEGDRVIVHPSDKVTDGVRVAERK